MSNLINGMHQERCKDCYYFIENTRVKDSNYGKCKKHKCMVLKNTGNCEEFKARKT